MVQRKLDDLHAAQERGQRNERRDVEYASGDHVWVLRPAGGDKLASRWTGPHVVVKRVGEDTWDVDVGNKIRRCHAAQLKKHVAALSGPSWPLHYQRLTPEEDAAAAEDDWTLSKILRHRRRADGCWEFLVRWDGFGAEGDQWEPAASFFPIVNTIFLEYLRKHNLTVPPAEMVQRGVASRT